MTNAKHSTQVSNSKVGGNQKPNRSQTYQKQKKRKPNLWQRFFNWLEWRFSTPEFAGGMLIGMAGFFFAAASNTLAGWLYVISGVSFALLLIGAVMPARLLHELEVERSQIEAVSAGDDITVELVFRNPTKTDKLLLEVRDILPEGMSNILKQEVVIEQIATNQKYYWSYTVPSIRRGVFQFTQVEIATASPFGLFRSRRSRRTPEKAIVYPTVLPLNQCPLIDLIGRDTSPRQYSPDHTHNTSTEGLTKTLRPYRWGDPTRLIHWRTSARFGELRVRELEVTIGGQEVVIALDTSAGWQAEAFEQAVVAAVSLYFYAQKVNLNVKLWTSTTDLLQGNRLVLETLAAIAIDEPLSQNSSSDVLDLPDLPVVWLTHRDRSFADLPLGSRWLLWQQTGSGIPPSSGELLGMVVDTNDPNTDLDGVPDTIYGALQSQLQSQLR
ncbi:DUF58 domain-containing protein [Tumidithrix helvetica PCC 7403]|uniref:DUF58 domain-containing protein n=1 Tax=Tumidithrix helvetica TaxID=3457545 RepID=UPI003CB8EFC4